MKRLSLLIALASCGCTTDTVPATIFDAAWCDVSALPCADISDPGSGLPASCAAPGLSAVPVTPPGGQRVCFDSSQATAAQACNLLCDPYYRSPVLFPGSTGCVATPNTSAEHGTFNNGSFVENGCTGQLNSVDVFLSGAGTSTVQLSGSLSVSYAGSSQDVAVTSGQLNFWAPNTNCNALDTSCPVQLNQLELKLGDVGFNGLVLSSWSLALDGPTLTASGQQQAPMPPNLPNPGFTFPTPPGVLFDVIGSLQGKSGPLPGFGATSDSEQNAAFDLVTGQTSIQLSLKATFDSQPFAVTGSLSSSTVTDLAPVVDPLAPLTLTGSGSPCSVQTSLTASASSPVGLPVSLTFAIDDGATAFAGPSAMATLYGAGDHRVSVLAVDSLGATTRATQTVTVTCP